MQFRHRFCLHRFWRHRVSRAAALAALSLALAAPAAAEPEPKIDCANATSNHEMIFCADEEYKAADLALNAAYQKALKAIPGLASEPPYDARSWEEALRKSQRAWVAFRDAECKDHTPMFWGGGTHTPLAVLGCLTAKTNARTKELNEDFAPN